MLNYPLAGSGQNKDLELLRLSDSINTTKEIRKLMHVPDKSSINKQQGI
jgi:hypothetical protein